MGKLSIYRRADGRYEGRIYLVSTNGKRIYRSFYGASAEEVRWKYERTTIPREEPKVQMTVKELFSEWFGILSSRIKESTAANYRMKSEKHIIPYFGKRRISEIESHDIYAFISEKLKSGLSARYVTDIIVLFKGAMKYAAKAYGVKNVFDGISLPKPKKAEVRLLNGTEQKILKDHIHKNPSLTDLGIAVSLYMGLRIGELCALKWENIDLQKRTLTVRNTIQRISNTDGNSKTKLVITEPKSENSRRTIPIPACIMGMLKMFESSDENYVLSDRTAPIEPRTMQYRFTRILKDLGLPAVHFHSLRHSFSCAAIEAGFDVKTLSEILGHSSTELTLKLYVHSSLERKRACMELLKWSA